MTHTEWCNPCLTSTDRLHPTAFKPDMVSQESMALMREVGTGHVFCAEPRQHDNSICARVTRSRRNYCQSRQVLPAEHDVCVHRSA